MRKEALLALAAQRGGRCLNADAYRNAQFKLTWQCQEGHTWLAKWHNVKHGSWCPQCKLKSEGLVRAFLEFVTGQSLPAARPRWLRNCGGPRAYYQLDGLNEDVSLAFEYHGPQHYREVPLFHQGGVHLKLQQERDEFVRAKCHERGLRLIEVSTLPAGTVEEQVAHIRVQSEPVLGPIADTKIAEFLLKPFGARMLDKLQAYAMKRHGHCLSPIFTGVRTKCLWQCQEGHEWEADWTRVQAGTWCPTCGNQYGPSEEMLVATAASRGGLCLTPSEYSRKAKLTWQCIEGHQWKATWTSIQQGRWCSDCAWKKVSADFTMPPSRLIAHATLMGGSCLNPEAYDGNTRKLRWRCRDGHEWDATWASVQQDHWCPHCARAATAVEQREPMAVILEKAAQLGGRLVAPAEYKNSATPVAWECHAGHSWIARWSDVKRGRWCSACKRALTAAATRACCSP